MLVSASANITNNGGDDRDFVCNLSQPIGDLARLIATSEVRVDTGGGELGTIALDGIAVNTQTPVELSLMCEGKQAPYTAQVLDPRIVAVKLGSATQK